MSTTDPIRTLQYAEAHCLAQGRRLTELRRKVLELIARADRPIGAYGLIRALTEGGRRRVGPPTVYRALGFLLEQGLIHRVESLNAFIACDAADAPHAAQFLICDGCRSTTEIHDSALEHWLRRATREFGFKLSGGIIEVRGVCSACQVAAAP